MFYKVSLRIHWLTSKYSIAPQEKKMKLEGTLQIVMSSEIHDETGGDPFRELRSSVRMTWLLPRSCRVRLGASVAPASVAPTKRTGPVRSVFR